jgi:hypothetical protein
MRVGDSQTAKRWLFVAAVAAIVGLGVVLFWPTLDLGLFADDYTAAAMLDGSFAAPRSRWDLFDFANGSPADVAALRRLGSVPWWAPDDLRISFLRPLSSLLWRLDRALFCDAIWLYHAHSIAAWALLVVAASALYRRLFGRGVAALAALMFAIDESQHFPVIWLSNRGGIYAVMLGVLGLHAHLRWRLERRPGFALASSALLCTGLLLGEWVLPMFGYIVAFEARNNTEPWTRRVRALAPSALPALCFLTGRALLGYGARGSGAYVDPAAEPARFLLSLVQRVPVFMADMLWNIPSSWWDQGTPWRDRVLGLGLFSPQVWVTLPDWPTYHLALGIAGFAALGLGVRFCWRDLSADERKRVEWLLLGSLLALVPVVGSFPSTRLTIAAFLGVAPALALVLRQICRRLGAAPQLGLARFMALYCVGVALLKFQLLEPLQDNIRAQVDAFTTTVPWVLRAELDPERVAQQRVYLLASNEFTTTFYFAYIWAHHGRPLPRSYQPITTAPYAHDVERISDNALRLRALGGEYLGSGQEYMFISSRRRWHDGQTVRLAGMQVTAENTRRGLPQSLLATFERSLDDPALVFLVASNRGLVRFKMPAIGETRHVPRASYPNWLGLESRRERQRIAPFPEMISFATPPGFLLYEPR